MSKLGILKSVAEEKSQGGTKLRDEVGRHSEEIGIDHQPIDNVSKLAMVVRGTDLATLYRHRELFSNRPEPVFPI